MDGKKLYETMLERMPPSMNDKPPVEQWSLGTALKATSVGRSILEQLEPEQAEKLDTVTGLPFIDDK